MRKAGMIACSIGPEGPTKDTPTLVKGHYGNVNEKLKQGSCDRIKVDSRRQPKYADCIAREGN
jgi:hypothetical protein